MYDALSRQNQISVAFLEWDYLRQFDFSVSIQFISNLSVLVEICWCYPLFRIEPRFTSPSLALIRLGVLSCVLLCCTMVRLVSLHTILLTVPRIARNPTAALPFGSLQASCMLNFLYTLLYSMGMLCHFLLAVRVAVYSAFIFGSHLTVIY